MFAGQTLYIDNSTIKVLFHFNTVRKKQLQVDVCTYAARRTTQNTCCILLDDMHCH